MVEKESLTSDIESVNLILRSTGNFANAQTIPVVHHRLRFSLPDADQDACPGRTRDLPSSDAILLRVMCSLTPAGWTRPRIAALSMLHSTFPTVSAPATNTISWLNHTPHATRCVGFVPGVAVGSRNTRFEAACWALPESDFHRLIAPASLGAFWKR
jgi:hypothetical protein